MKNNLKKMVRYMFQGTGGQFGQISKGTAEATSGAGTGASLISPLFNADFATFFGGMFKVAIAAGAILAVLRLGYGGFMYMTSDIWSKKDTAKKILNETMFGLALLLAIWVILYQIYPGLLNLDIFSVPKSNAIQPAGQLTPSSGPGADPSQNH